MTLRLFYSVTCVIFVPESYCVVVTILAPCNETPYIQKHGKKKQFEKNDNFVLPCLAAGDIGSNSSPLKWKKSNSISLGKNIEKKLASDILKEDIYYDRLQLIVRNAQRYNEGLYTCERELFGCKVITNTSIMLTYTGKNRT